MRSSRVFGLTILIMTVTGAWVGCGGDDTKTTGSGGEGGTGSASNSASSVGPGPVGSGGSSPAKVAACDAPPIAPSGGKCFNPGSGAGGGGGAPGTGGAGGAPGTGGAGGAPGTGGAGGAPPGAGGAGGAPPGAGGAGGAPPGAGGAGGAPPAPECTQILNPNDCGLCLEGSCCAELADCNEDVDCLECFLGNEEGAACEEAVTKAILTKMNGCFDTKCVEACTPEQCNPVTNEGCDAAGGFACDLGNGGYQCFPPDNDQPICSTECNNADGPWCEATHHCLEEGECAKYCCDDGDCGTGKCDKGIIGDPDIGVCVKK